MGSECSVLSGRSSLIKSPVWRLKNQHLHQIRARRGCNLRQGEEATFENQPPRASRATIVPLGAANSSSGTARLATVPCCFASEPSTEINMRADAPLVHIGLFQPGNTA